MSKLSLSLCASLLLSLLLGQEGDDKKHDPVKTAAQQTRNPVAAQAEPSCTVCHPGHIRSLRRSPHHSLIREDKKDTTCLACHGEAPKHEEHPHQAIHFPKPAMARCASCHEELKQIPDLAHRLAHPRRSEALEILRNPIPRRNLHLDGQSHAESWPLFEGFFEMGYRFLSVSGNKGTFRQDFGIREGLMLRDVGLSLRYPHESKILTLEGRDFGERASSVDFETGKGLWERTTVEARWRRRYTTQEAFGDYYALDREHEVYGTSLDWNLDTASNHQLSFDWERLMRRGRTLASSIGHPAQVPLQPARGVPVDFRLQVDRLATNYGARLGVDTQLNIEVAWEEQEQRDGLDYTRPSPANPGFTESEASSSQVFYRGPEAQLMMSGGRDLHWRIFLSGYYRSNEYRQSSFFTAYDSSAFTLDRSGTGKGSSRRLAASLGLDWEAARDIRIDLALNLFDLVDKSRFRLQDTLVRTSPPSSTTTTRFWNPVTRLRKLEATLGMEHETSKSFRYGLGMAYTWQYLELPDLDPADQDYLRGSLQNFGPRGDLDWRPAKGSRLHASLELLATSGETPTDTQPEQGLRAKASLDQDLSETWDMDFNFLYDNRRNDSSQTKRQTLSFGGGILYSPTEDRSFRFRAQFTDFDSKTLSTFYYAPSTTPLPTLVGYEGHNLTLGTALEQSLSARLRGSLDLSWQHLEGDLASSFLELALDLEYEISQTLRTGIRYSLWDWNDRLDPTQDYRTNALFVYGAFRF